MRVVELRSDTKTLPTAEMYRAMVEADLGDDGDQEDPTVKRLEAIAAERFGKEAGLFVASGTMGNLLSLMSHCERGKEIILGETNHIHMWEVGGAAAIGGLSATTVPVERFGTMPLDRVRAAIRPEEIWEPQTGLICVENTHNRCGGTVLPLDYLASLRKLADEFSLPIHMDGARIFNAAVYLNVDVKEIANYVDSLQACFSKGLSAPVGSVIVGRHSFVERARRLRQMLGGSMRQTGVIAGPAIVALQGMAGRLQEDHANARRLAEGLAEINGLHIELDTVQTNIVVADLVTTKYSTQSFIDACAQLGVLVSCYPDGALRFVTHRGVDADDVMYAIDMVYGVMSVSDRREI